MVINDLLYINYKITPGGFGEYVINIDKLDSVIDNLKNELKSCWGSKITIDIYEARENEFGAIKSGNLIETKNYEYKL